ncbi:zymogen granule membrane protein 16-like [Gastrophryne carolinensis]
MLLWILLSVCCLAAAQQRGSSFSGEFGGGGGKRFSQSGNQLDGPITGFRVRSNYLFITGMQVRYGKMWSEYQGGRQGNLDEILLFPGEHIVQVTGKHIAYLHQISFITNKHRTFDFGNGSGTKFTAAPLYPNTVLRYISGSSGIYINAIGLHWNYPSSNCEHCT